MNNATNGRGRLLEGKKVRRVMEKLLGPEWTSFVETAIKVTYPLLVGVGGFFGTKVLSNEMRIVAIEANRYTQKDAAQDRLWFSAEMNKIRQDQVVLIRELNDKHTELLKALNQSTNGN